MAQNLEPSQQSHVPQQNLRNKLRVTQVQQQHHLPLQADPLQPNSKKILQMNPSPASPSFSSLQQDLDKEFFIINYQQPSLTNRGISNLSLSLAGQLDNQCYNCEVPALKDFLKQNNSDQMRNCLVPLGPFTGYSSILKSSKFLKPAQEVLDNMCGRNCESLEFPHLDCSLGNGDSRCTGFGILSDGMDCGWKNSKLMLMLDEVHKRYKLYCQQMQSVVTSFSTVAGLGNSAPYVWYAVKVVSKYFASLKNALLDQIHSTGKTPADDGNPAKEKPTRSWRGEHFLQNQDSISAARFLQNPVWRSQRGLPDHAVSVLKTWLFEHFLHPYPTDSEKQNLAQQTGLSRTQVSNWFINARVRLWKPMVEEVHMLESQQAQVQQKIINQNQVAAPSDSPKEKLSQANSRRQCNENWQSKRYRSELLGQEQEQGRMSCLNHPIGPGVSGSNEVSLALGLHQNNGIDLSWPMPIDMHQHVNLEMMKMMDSTPATSFGSPSQHFGRNV